MVSGNVECYDMKKTKGYKEKQRRHWQGGMGIQQYCFDWMFWGDVSDVIWVEWSKWAT